MILGVKMNGISFEFEELSIDDDQQKYNYICDITNIDTNGNGIYSITILDKAYKHGVIFNGWELKGGKITYDWGGSNAYFVLQDSLGHKANDIYALGQKGSMGGFDVIKMVQSIFYKAVDIMRNYENVEEYNVLFQFEKSIKNEATLWYKSESDYDYALGELSEAIVKYRSAIKYLKKKDNEKSNLKIIELREKMREYLTWLKPREF